MGVEGDRGLQTGDCDRFQLRPRLLRTGRRVFQIVERPFSSERSFSEGEGGGAPGPRD